MDRSEVKFAPPAFERKIRPPESLAGGIAGVARPLVFTNGVFDILHRGHAAMFVHAHAKAPRVYGEQEDPVLCVLVQFGFHSTHVGWAIW